MTSSEPECEEPTRAEIEWLEHTIKQRTERLHQLLPSDAVTLKLVDRYRQEKGWDEPGDRIE